MNISSTTAGWRAPCAEASSSVYPPPPPAALQRLGATVVGNVSTLFGKALIAAGLRRPHEGWRRIMGIMLRSEFSRFAMASFGLRVPTDASGVSIEDRVAGALLGFLDGDPDAHFALTLRGPITLRRSIDHVDLVVLGFSQAGTLASVTPRLSRGGQAAPGRDVEKRVHDAVIREYNATRHLPEVPRAQQLAVRLRKTLRSEPGGQQYAERLLRAASLSFEQADLADANVRFTPPPFAARRSLGSGHLSWIARPHPSHGSVDLWASAHHVGLDGTPLQDLLNRLEASWGIAEAVTYPAPTGGAAFAEATPCAAPGERAIDHIQTFVDLGPVFALRQAINARFGSAIGGVATLGAVLGWLLSQEPELEGVRIASTVDVAPSAGYERDVDVVALRAADFMSGDGSWDGFVTYAREFNQLIAAAHARTSPIRVGIQTAGLMPAWAHSTVVRADPGAADDAFGSLCVTIVRDARVFIAPMNDFALPHGVFAIGSAKLPSASGGHVTAVSIKGDAGRMGRHPEILQRAIDRAAKLLGSLEGE
jgi:hypothetical protein